MITCAGVNNIGGTEIRSVDCGKSKKNVRETFITDALNGNGFVESVWYSDEVSDYSKISQMITVNNKANSRTRLKPYQTYFPILFWILIQTYYRRRSWYEHEVRRRDARLFNFKFFKTVIIRIRNLNSHVV